MDLETVIGKQNVAIRTSFASHESIIIAPY